jgi:hypothetical protein
LARQWINAGWQLGEFSSTGGTFFCRRGARGRGFVAPRGFDVRAANTPQYAIHANHRPGIR